MGRSSSWYPRIGLFLVATIGFALAYCQAPLYYANQNQYFLHGLAQGGVGLLSEDWLAKTQDPTPAFSAIVAFTVAYIHPTFFYVYYAVLQGAYACSMFLIFAYLSGPRDASKNWPIFVVLFVAIHSALGRWCSYRLFGQDYPWFFQAGVAGQYILGATLQPSTFGVLFVVAICCYLHDRPVFAACLTCLAANVHASYLPTAGLLTLGFLADSLQKGQFRRAPVIAILSLVLVLPIIAYFWIAFAPTGSEQFTEAQIILVNFRIPHHARPDRWFDAVALLQIVWMLLAFALVRRSRLFLLLFVPFVLAASLTLCQIFTESPFLALLFPWRISAVLVPVATTIILTRLTLLFPGKLEVPFLKSTSVAIVTGLVLSGICLSWYRVGFQTGAEENQLLQFVREHKRSGDVYFIPVSLPKPLEDQPRGSLSSDFKPVADKRLDNRVIPVDLQGFRLATGQPIYIDFKSIPYKDVEILEWRSRLRSAQSIQNSLRNGNPQSALPWLSLQGITHVVVPASAPWKGDWIEQIYSDDSYLIYRLKHPPVQ